MRQNRRTLTLLLTAAALLLVLPVAASASRAPVRQERLQLREAVKRSGFVPAPVRRGRFELVRPRISTEGRWALSTIQPTGRLRRQLDAVVGLFQFRRGVWRLAQAGTAGVGCGKLIVPRDVRRDLGIRCA
jgi:hypothetical protein